MSDNIIQLYEDLIKINLKEYAVASKRPLMLCSIMRLINSSTQKSMSVPVTERATALVIMRETPQPLQVM